MSIWAWIGLIVGVLVFAWLFDHFFGFFSWLFRKITGKRKPHTIGDFKKIIEKI